MSTKNAPYLVTTVGYGSLRVDWEAQLYGRTPGRLIESPVWGAVLEGNGLRILVDTGIRDPAVVSQTLVPCTQRDDQTPTGFLDVLGWRAEDIDIVINTHLHFDHCGHNGVFPHARFYVARAEWDHAMAPGDVQPELYVQRDWLRGGLAEEQYVLVDDDDVEVAPGIILIRTPGHSVGHQSVLVDTEDGWLCVAGDAVNIDENFTERTPVGTVADHTRATASIEVIRARADRVLMAHDDRLSAYFTGPYPLVPGGGDPTYVCTC